MIERLIKDDNFHNEIRKLQKDNWKKLDEDARNECLQNIVNAYMADIGNENPYEFLTKRYFKYGIIGQHSEKYNDISLQYELVANGRLEIGENEYREIEDPTNYVFFYLTHEIWHGTQAYFLSNREKLDESYQNDLDLLSINRAVENSNSNFYFDSPDKNSKDPDAQFALYLLQPIERQAFEFACEEYKKFIEMMNKEFPQDPAYKYVDDISGSVEAFGDMNRVYYTRNAVLDMENIIKTFDGQFVEVQLNQHMCNDIKKLFPNVYEKIQVQEAANIKRVRDELKELQRAEDAIEVDPNIFDDRDFK